jgi:ubiquinone/menaquinone biosynthesis C-methylase UbiE
MKLSLLLSIAALAAFPQAPHQHHPPRDAKEYARVLNDPGRDKWQKPHEVVEALKLKPGEAIADIGAGTGYFATHFARHAKKVYAVDIDPQLLEMAKKDAPENLETVPAAPDDPRLPEASVDTLFFCNVLHHIGSRPGYYEKLKKALKPGGRIVNIDFHKRGCGYFGTAGK